MLPGNDSQHKCVVPAPLPRYIVLCFTFGARCGAFEYQFVVLLGGNCVHCVVHCGCFLPPHVGIVPRYTRPFAVYHGVFAVCLLCGLFVCFTFVFVFGWLVGYLFLIDSW